MTHTVTSMNDAVNYACIVSVDGKQVLSLPYTSWYNPSGKSATSQAAAAGEITQNLTTALGQPAPAGGNSVQVMQDGLKKAFDVFVNGYNVASFGYSGLWVIGGLVASTRAAKANAYGLANNLSVVLGLGGVK